MADDKIPRSPAPLRTWRAPASSSDPSSTNASRGRTILYFCLLLAAIAGVVVAFFFYIDRPPAPYFLALTFSEYHSDHVPYNAFADRDGDDLRACLGGEDAFAKQELHFFIKELHGLEQRKDQTVIVYLRAYAVARKGQVLILPAEEDETKWYPLRDVLDHLDRCESRNKLLLLDLMRPVADVRLGVLADNVAAHVEKILQSRTDSNLQVLTACSPGQVSLLAPGFQRSVFGYYLEQGLAGAADGYQEGGARNTIVSVNELAAFVTARVDRWALHRGTRQTPILSGAANDFALKSYKELPPPKDCNLVMPFDEAEWKLRDDWREGNSARKSSDELRRLQTELLRAENIRAGGGTKAAKLDDFRTQIIPKPPAAAKQPPAAPDGKPPEAPAATFREKLERALDKMQIKEQVVEVKDDKGKPAAEVKPDKDIEDAMTEGKNKIKTDRDGFVKDLVTVMASEPRANRHILKWLTSMVEAWPTQQPPRAVELVRKLTGRPLLLINLDDKFWKGQAAEKAVQHAFDAVRRANEIDSLDEKTRGWIKADVLNADAKYNEGLENLRNGAGNETKSANAARELGEAAAGYKRALETGLVVARAQTTCKDALAFLPEYAPYLTSPCPNPLLNQAKKWSDAADSASKLNELLSAPSRDAADGIAEIRATETDLQEKLQPLRDQFGDLIKELLRVGNAAADPNRCAQLHAILQTPRTTTAERKELWNALRRDEEDLHKITTSKDQEEDQAKIATPPLPAFSPATSDWKREIDLAYLRGQVAIGLLQLRGSKEMQISDAHGNLVNVTTAQLWSELSTAFDDARTNHDLGAFDDLAEKIGKCMKVRPTSDASTQKTVRLSD